MTCAAHNEALPARESVTVNGVTISHDAIAREVQHHPSAKPVAAWQAAACALVVRELLLQEAARLGIETEPEPLEGGQRETEEEACIRALVAQEVTTPEPDEAVCRRYYEQNRKHFRTETIYEAAHILFAARQDDEETYAQAACAADLALAVLRQEPERFGDLAKEHSACSSAAQGGNLGQITAGQTTTEFEQALFALTEGEIGTVKTPYGLHILRLDRKIEGSVLPFDLVSARIAEYLRDTVTRRATAQYVARLVSGAEIEGVTLAGATGHQVS